MTFAELVLLIAVGVLLYKILVPLRRRIEVNLYRFFRARMHGKEKPVIDITNYRKKEDPKNEN